MILFEIFFLNKMPKYRCSCAIFAWKVFESHCAKKDLGKVLLHCILYIFVRTFLGKVLLSYRLPRKRIRMTGKFFTFTSK